MGTQRDLYFYEEIMLLALRDREGTVAADDTSFAYTLGGSLLADLLLMGKISIDQAKKKKKLVDLDDSVATGDPLLDECLEKLRNAKRRASLGTWVSRFAGLKKLKQRAAQQLCRRGILRADEGKVLLIFNHLWRLLGLFEFLLLARLCTGPILTQTQPPVNRGTVEPE